MNTTKKNELLKTIVDESDKTKRAREKLKQKFNKTDQKMTPQALKAKSQEISQWIERRSSDRISVQKDISLFDQNRNSAKMSRSTQKRAGELAIDLEKAKQIVEEK